MKCSYVIKWNSNRNLKALTKILHKRIKIIYILLKENILKLNIVSRYLQYVGSIELRRLFNYYLNALVNRRMKLWNMYNIDIFSCVTVNVFNAHLNNLLS